MTNHDAAVLGIRLAALYAGFQALEYFSMVGMFVIQSTNLPGNVPHPVLSLIYLLPCALYIITAILLFKKAPFIAGSFLVDSSERSTVSGSGNSALSIGFGIAGLFGLIISAPRVISPILLVYLHYKPFGDPNANQAFLLQNVSQIAGPLVQAILSFVILVKSRALAEWWQRKQG